MSFGKSKDAGMEQKDEDGDIFYRPPKGDPFYDDMENFHPEDLSREGIQRMKEKQQRKDSISRPTKLQKLPSKEFRALREKKSRERFRNAHPLPKRPALRNMSTTPDLRDRNKRDSGFINDLIPEFPAPPHRLRPQEHPALQELQAKRARLASASVADLSLESRIAAGRARKPSTVLWIDRPVNKPVGIPPLPPLPPGAARPRLPSQPSVSFVEHAAARARAI
ncbi:hypothetical protein SCHPADRAFT_899763 [Schizopora paradoxa]|uniref:Uncharacterized protein n=1 Tax=Schizopora paradoxa TaxID=27342 RepID=A0A0H2S2W7_9AGAM|nr:hypothetical protein SCHPADRAFT_899763 [Schizopora paradoxa]